MADHQITTDDARDASRYRWLRAQCWVFGGEFVSQSARYHVRTVKFDDGVDVGGLWQILSPDSDTPAKWLDAAIDMAIAEDALDAE